MSKRPPIDSERRRALRALKTRAERQRQLNEEIDAYVVMARDSGASWTELGDALGITKQSTWQRFRHLERSDTYHHEAQQASSRIMPGVPQVVINTFREASNSHRFAVAVRELEDNNPEVRHWLQTPNTDIQRAVGLPRPYRPLDLLETENLRNYLMTASANRT